jgi:broad specificity phosphatase PhoE
MGTLLLVRHGQASFGQADYDRLSPLGERQCVQLGRYLKSRGRRFGAVLRGTLRRHEQSLAALANGYGELPAASLWPGLDEYDSHAVLRAVHPGPLPPPSDHDAYRQHFRLLREGLQRWAEGDLQPEGMPTWDGWMSGVAAALAHVQQLPPEQADDVLLVSSGGPISTAVVQVLGAPGRSMIELNLRLRNSALTEIVFNPRRLSLHSFNALPHLDGPEWAGCETYT